MKKNILISTLLLASSLFAEPAKETEMFPLFTSANYCSEATVALMGGVTNYHNTSGYTDSYGAELRFACPVFQIKGFDNRQVLSVVYAEKDGLTTTSIEMNPRIMFPVSDDIEFGFGPGLGVIFAENDTAVTTGSGTLLDPFVTTTSTSKDTVIGVNIGASLHYNVTESVFVGLESRYQWTQNTKFGKTIDNARTMLKVGTSF